MYTMTFGQQEIRQRYPGAEAWEGAWNVTTTNTIRREEGACSETQARDVDGTGLAWRIRHKLWKLTHKAGTVKRWEDERKRKKDVAEERNRNRIEGAIWRDHYKELDKQEKIQRQKEAKARAYVRQKNKQVIVRPPPVDHTKRVRDAAHRMKGSPPRRAGS